MSSRNSRFQDNYRAAARTRSGKRGGRVANEFRVPRQLMPENGIEHDEQLAHASGKRDLGFLARPPATSCKTPAAPDYGAFQPGRPYKAPRELGRGRPQIARLPRSLPLS